MNLIKRLAIRRIVIAARHARVQLKLSQIRRGVHTMLNTSKHRDQLEQLARSL
jgi:hypothetical protein